MQRLLRYACWDADAVRDDLHSYVAEHLAAGGPALDPARIRALIAWKFSLDCSSAGVWRLLHRHRWCRQSPARRALERDEHAVDLWKKDVWPQAE
ncbi:winged helix-turn-helix domain-containing protein [Streptomyces sviceus]